LIKIIMLFEASVIITFALAFAQVNAADHQHAKKPTINGKQVSTLFRRSGTCSFPTDKGLVAVQKNGQNAGWAMHSDQQCTYGSWCPYACPPGQLMNQWDPSVTSYSYPGSQNGGLWCNDNGELEAKRNGNYCVDGAGTVQVNNKANLDVAFCQTVLPGNEEMLIPTNVGGNSQQKIAVPTPDYWASTAAHYYVNAPGVSVDDGCKWGSVNSPVGNWAPYVAGANQDSSGNTFVKIGWNPVYLEQTTPFRNTRPTFGIRITCNDGDCDGTPCEIDPSKVDVNGISSGQSTGGAGGGAFCVVTAKSGKMATIEVFDASASKSKREAEHVHHAHNQITKTKIVTLTTTV
jgi:hypothetical protein